jgi:hypothetical protein
MSTNTPPEIVAAKLSIEAAYVTLEALFARMPGLPRAEKMIVSEQVREACSRIQAAKELLQQLESMWPDP